MKTTLKKPLVIASVISSMAFASLAGVAAVSAATPGDGQSGLIDKIATKFNLNKDDVKAVFDEDRAAHEAEMQKHQEEKLSQLVTDGKLTAEQKDKIIAKQAELKAAHEAEKDSMSNKTKEERRAAMEAKRTELEQWAKDNGIPSEYIHLVGGFGHHGGYKGGEPR